MDKLTKETLDYFRLSAETEPLRRLWFQGDLFKLLCPSAHIPPPASKKDRVIREMSAQARKRALEFSATVDWDKAGTCLWLNVGYPDQCLPRDKDTLKADRYLFHRYFEDHLRRRVPGMWRVEWEKRKSGRFVGTKMPHYHILLMDVGEMPYTRIRLWWKNIIKPPIEPSMRFRRLYDGKQKAQYLAKYCAKLQPGTNLGCLPNRNSTGKSYGYFREELIPRRQRYMSRQLSTLEASALYNLAAMLWPKLNPRRLSGFSVFKSKWPIFLKELAKLGLTPPQGAV